MSSVVQAQKVVQGDEVGSGVHHRLLLGNIILCCSIGRVGTGVCKNINLHISDSVKIMRKNCILETSAVFDKCHLLSSLRDLAWKRPSVTFRDRI